MKKFIYMPLLILFLFPFCGRKNIIEENNVPRMSLADTLHLLMEKALVLDSFEYVTDSLPFAYLKTGYFLDSLTKRSLLIYNPADTSYTVKLYTQDENKWIKNDSVSGLWGLPAFFKVQYQDFNFDGINDIYIQTSVSDNLSVSRGHLFTVDRDSLKLKYHAEAKDMGNLTPDKENKVVYSQEAVIDNYGEWKFQTSTNEWIDKVLTVTKKDNPCDPDARE